MELFNVYDLNQNGISYAAQGYHIGDGVTLRADVVRNHALITRYLAELKLKAKTKPNGQKSL